MICNEMLFSPLLGLLLSEERGGGKKLGFFFPPFFLISKMTSISLIIWRTGVRSPYFTTSLWWWWMGALLLSVKFELEKQKGCFVIFCSF